MLSPHSLSSDSVTIPAPLPSVPGVEIIPTTQAMTCALLYSPQIIQFDTVIFCCQQLDPVHVSIAKQALNDGSLLFTTRV